MLCYTQKWVIHWCFKFWVFTFYLFIYLTTILLQAVA